MDNRSNMRNNWWNGGGGNRSQLGLKGRPSPRMAPPHPPPDTHSPHDDLINYIYEAWDKISREGAPVWEASCSAQGGPPLPPLDLESWLGHRQRMKHPS